MGRSIKKVSIISTIDHNVGDDFVREGIIYLLEKAYPNYDFDYNIIHKHSPITVRDGYENIRNKYYGNILDRLLPVSTNNDKILSSDLVIQSGAPVYWCHNTLRGHCYQNEWYDLLINKRVKKYKLPLVNLAAGTCQTFHSNGNDFCKKCKNYIINFYDNTILTTVRDELSFQLLSSLDKQTYKLPCTSIFARDKNKMEEKQKKYFVINYMKIGGHYSFGQSINKDIFHEQMVDFYHSIKDKYQVVFSCHNSKEVENARAIDNNVNIFYAKNDYKAYMELYSEAKIGVVNRVHAGFMMASFNTPSLIIGNDSRARMSKELELDNIFVNDFTSSYALKWIDDNLNIQYESVMKAIKKKSLDKYISLLEDLNL